MLWLFAVFAVSLCVTWYFVARRRTGLREGVWLEHEDGSSRTLVVKDCRFLTLDDAVAKPGVPRLGQPYDRESPLKVHTINVRSVGRDTARVEVLYA